MTENQRFNGGQVALIGFLYQMVGTLGLLTWAACPEEPTDNEELSALLAAIRDGEVYHERGDMDALVRQLGLDRSHASVLIQFKYSQRPENYPLQPSQLAEICQGFLRELERWSTHSSHVFFRVITNRPMSLHTRLLLQQPKGQREHESFKEEHLKGVLQGTEIIENIDFDSFQNPLRLFADQYGTDEDEYGQGLQKLIGMLVERATRPYDQPICEQDLIKAFRGHAPLRKLTAMSIREQTLHDRKDMMRMLGLQGMPVLRKRLVEEALMRAKEHALLVFQGPGGCGKSVLAWHVLHSILEEQDETKCAPTAFLPLRDVQSLSWLVGEWMGLPEDKRNEPSEQVIRRIKIANSTAHPVLYLGIDGLDEKNEMVNGYVSLRQIIMWFWKKERALQEQLAVGRNEPPEATLILTCRDRDLLSPLLGTSLWTDMRGQEGYTLPVEDYSPEELLDASH